MVFLPLCIKVLVLYVCMTDDSKENKICCSIHVNQLTAVNLSDTYFSYSLHYDFQLQDETDVFRGPQETAKPYSLNN